jgi:hypothetical protein
MTRHSKILPITIVISQYVCKITYFSPKKWAATSTATSTICESIDNLNKACYKVRLNTKSNPMQKDCSATWLLAQIKDSRHPKFSNAITAVESCKHDGLYKKYHKNRISCSSRAHIVAGESFLSLCHIPSEPLVSVGLWSINFPSIIFCCYGWLASEIPRDSTGNFLFRGRLGWL